MKLWPLAILCFAIGVASPTFANPAAPVVLPTGGQVVSGAATITGRTGSSLTITQSSTPAIVNWSPFNIGSSGATTFVQPSASSSVLNRVISNPSAIYGRLSSNGRVWLVSPGSIAVGSTTIAPSPAPTAAPQPSRPALSVATPANPVRMIDGAVTLRTPLVDASPILFR